MIGERLHRARKAADLSLRGLAEEVGVSHTWISKYEKNEAMPDSGALLKLGKALGVRSEYFFRPQKITLSHIEYRKKSTLPKKRLKAIEHEILDRVERRMELEKLFPQPPISPFEIPEGLPDRISNLDDIENTADFVREQWKLGQNPIPVMIDLFESNSIRVFCIDARSDRKFDGLLAYVADSPVVVVGRYWPGDRQRFTLAHELGHMLLDKRLAEGLDLEKGCNRFAGAFLFPHGSVRKALGKCRSSIDDRELYALKHEYGLSMATILRRAFDLGIISKGYYTHRNIQFRKKGWHTSEPGQGLSPEKGHVFETLIFHALAEEFIGDSKAAELLGMSLDRFRQFRSMEMTDAAPCQ